MTDRRRRQKEQRAAKREAERKATQRKELGKRLTVALGFGALVVGIFAVGAIFGEEEGSLPSGYESYREQPTACGGSQPDPQPVLTFDQAEQQTDLDELTTATIETSCGTIQIELDTSVSRDSVNSFVFLARQGFYDGQVFYRILDGSRVEGGDPAADGSGGPGYEVADEFPPEDFVYEDGHVLLNNVGKGTTGSQFFVVLEELAPRLNPQFNLVGKVVSGQDVLDRIVEVPVATRPGSREQSLPLETVYINQITIESGS